MPEGERINVYLPYTLARRVHEAKSAGAKLNVSAGAARGIAEELDKLNGHHTQDADHQADEEQLDHQAAEVGGRLDAIERTLGRLVAAVAAMFALVLVAAGVAVISVRALALTTEA